MTATMEKLPARFVKAVESLQVFSVEFLVWFDKDEGGWVGVLYIYKSYREIPATHELGRSRFKCYKKADVMSEMCDLLEVLAYGFE